jgi:N-acyl-D-amino-acid deacylase
MSNATKLWRALLLLVFITACGGAPEYDIIIRNGTVLDGTGTPRYMADIAISGEAIARVGDLSGVSAVEEVDATGMFVSPGFINLHSHDRLDAAPTAANLLAQGVTTIILNADGGGPLDISAQVTEAEALGLAVNIGPTIGFNSAWAEVNGREETRPDASQIKEMASMVEAGLEAGAWGVSAGLDYTPAYFARMEDVIAVLSRTGRWRSLFTNHDRTTPETGYSSLVGMRETVEIGEATGLMPLITHMKIQGSEQGTSAAVLAMMTEATNRGAYTAADVYPYLAGQTSLMALIIPSWAQAGTRDQVLSRFGDPALRGRIIREANEALDLRFGGPSGVFLPETQTELTDVMEEMGATSGGETVVRLLQESDDSPSAILRFGSEEDLAAIMAHPTSSIACDCDATAGPAGHPRYYGTFPRALGRYVRELGVLSWEDAIRKMTGLPATTVGMVDRGYLASGMAADVVVFDPETVIDHATFMDPTAASEGVHQVFVNGTWALRDGAPISQRAGKGLLRSANMPARSMSLGEAQSVAARGTVDSGTSRFELEMSVRQIAGARVAEGDFHLTAEDGSVDFVATNWGVLQTTDGWASFTARGLTAGGDERSAFVVLDTADPTTEVGSINLMVVIEGMEPIMATVTGDVTLPNF